MSNLVTSRDDGTVRLITLSRPEKLNAMSSALVDQLSDALIAAEKNSGVAVIVIAAEGRAFCAGADLSGRDEAPPSPRQVAASVNHAIEFYKLLVNFDTPMIAAVNGYALGGGCNLAVSCDLVVAAEDAVFGYPEVKLGMPAAGVAPPLVHQIGRKAAFELLALCDNIDAAKALEMGLINRIVPAERLLPTATAMAHQLAAYNHDALRLTKQLIRRCADMPLDNALDLGRDIGLAMNVYQS